jgi:hypothetical protein
VTDRIVLISLVIAATVLWLAFGAVPLYLHGYSEFWGSAHTDGDEELDGLATVGRSVTVVYMFVVVAIASMATASMLEQAESRRRNRPIPCDPEFPPTIWTTAGKHQRQRPRITSGRRPSCLRVFRVSRPMRVQRLRELRRSRSQDQRGQTTLSPEARRVTARQVVVGVAIAWIVLGVIDVCDSHLEGLVVGAVVGIGSLLWFLANWDARADK